MSENSGVSMARWVSDEIECVVRQAILEKTYEALPWYRKLQWAARAYAREIRAMWRKGVAKLRL